MRSALLLLFALWPVLGAAQSRFEPEQAELLQEGLVTTADGFILPAYVVQAEATAALVDALQRYCRAEGDITEVHASFADTFLAWQRSSIVQVGPIMEAEGPMRVQLWPDPKGFSKRAIRAAMSTEDAALLAEGGLEGRSIALTNLTALETLVHNALPPGEHACDLAKSIAVFQANLAASLVAGWTPGSAFRSDYDTAAAGNPRYTTIDDLIRELLAGAVVYVDRLRKFKLLRGLGQAPGEARPERTEATESGLGLKSIEVSFRALSDLYDTPFGLFDIAPDIGGSMEYFVLAQTAGTVADGLALQTASLTEIAAEDGAQAAKLRTLAELVLFHENYLKTGFASAIGLTAGFTAADGD